MEVKGRGEGLRVKKKLESDLNELELQVDLFTKNNIELTKNTKKMQQQIKVRFYTSIASLPLSFALSSSSSPFFPCSFLYPVSSACLTLSSAFPSLSTSFSLLFPPSERSCIQNEIDLLVD